MPQQAEEATSNSFPTREEPTSLETLADMGATVQRFVLQPAAWDQTGNCTAPPSDQNQAPDHSDQQPAVHDGYESAMTTAQIAIAVCNHISAVHASPLAEADDPAAGADT